MENTAYKEIMTINNSRPGTSGSAQPNSELSPEDIQGVIDRILAKEDAAEAKAPDGKAPRGRAQALSMEDAGHSEHDGDQEDLRERHALRRVAGLSTELEDVTEVEYRQLRLERVVLAGLWSEGTAADAENSLQELAALARENGLDFAVDVYPRYSSDASAALRAGLEARHALIGPGVFASHGYERTHKKGIENTLRLVSLFVAR